MRTVVCTAYGPPESLVVEERPDPEPGPGQVVVAVEAAGVNYVDSLFVQGTYQIRIPPPFTPGTEFAGRVAALGEGVEGLAVGDRVMCSSVIGAYASHVVVPAGALIRLPDGFPTQRAAAFIQSYATAWFSLTRRTTVAPGETVLVLGAGGGIGLATIDVARALGARVIAAASSADKLAAARAMGADELIDYESEDLKTRAKELSGGGVDVVVDPVGSRHAEPALRATGWFGRFVVIGFAGGSIPSLPANLVLLNNRTVVGVDWGAWAGRNREANQAMLGELLDAVVAGRLHPTEPTAYPLTDAGRVLRNALERRLTGKAILVP